MREKEIQSGEALIKYSHSYQRIIKGSANDLTVDENLELAFITIIAKNVDGLHAIGHLLKTCPIESTYFSIAGILRGCLLNGIIALYLANKIEPLKTDIEQRTIREEIEIIYIDQIGFLLKDLIYLKQNSTDITEAQILNYINENFGHYLNEQLENLHDKPNFKHKPQRRAVKHYVSNTDANKQLSLKLLDGYIYYSKIDHLGILTYKYYSSIFENKAYESNRLLGLVYDVAIVNEAFRAFLKTDEIGESAIIKMTAKLKVELKESKYNIE